VGNHNPAKGIAGDYWLFLLALLLLLRLRRWLLLRLRLRLDLVLVLVLPPLNQALCQCGKVIVANSSGCERYRSLRDVIKARAIRAVGTADNVN
jgi:hypothetical protein